MELIKNILNSNFVNKTILKNCQHYKVRRYNSATTQNFTFAELETFKKVNNIHYYYITKPSTQKTFRMQHFICNTLAFCCFVSAFIILSTLKN